MTDLQNDDAIISAISIGEPQNPQPIFEWRLNPETYKSTIFDKKKMVEMTDIKKVYGFIKNQMGINYDGIKRYSGIPYKTELDQIIKYKECYNKNKKVYRIISSTKTQMGSVNPSISYLIIGLSSTYKTFFM